MCAFLSLCLKLQSMVPEGPGHPHCGTSLQTLLSLEQRETDQGSKPGSTSSGLVLLSGPSFAPGAWDSPHSSFISGSSLPLLGPLTLIFTLSLVSGPFAHLDPAASDV